MRKGDRVICVSHSYREDGEMLTVGEIYVVTAGLGDTSMFGLPITCENGWEAEHDNGMTFYQRGLEGSHGVFELVD